MVNNTCPRCGGVHPADVPCPMRTSAASLAPGTMLAGRYRILSAVHAGGMSMVYRAEDTRSPSSSVAIKELRVADDAGDEDRREAEAWFGRESYVLSSLHHPMIPSFYGVFHEG